MSADSLKDTQDAIFRASVLSNAGRPNDAFMVLVDEVKRLRNECRDKALVLKSAVENRSIEPYKLPVLAQQVSGFLEGLANGH